MSSTDLRGTARDRQKALGLPLKVSELVPTIF
jgi:hypothetical protein